MNKRYDLTTIKGILASAKDHDLTITPSVYFRLGEEKGDSSDGGFEVPLAGQDMAARRLIAAIHERGPAMLGDAPEFVLEKGIGLNLENWGWFQLQPAPFSYSAEKITLRVMAKED
jgi:hypothetical protein